ncbi:MAG: UDP-glucuronic acid decarboxylase family protein [Bacillota bacterium]|jgi:dTDP-glucose 4,6-dehydratase
MKAIVTGGAGFIGSHLCDRLLGMGLDVIAIDNLCTGSLKNISHIDSPHFSFIRHDVTKPLPVLMEADYIFHLASPASPVDYQNLALETLAVNSIGTLNMLELAVKLRAKFLLASTSECYGDPLIHPQPETYWGHVNPVGPRSCYDESKRFAESLTMSYIKKYGLDARIVRIFNTYGPRMRAADGRVVPNFVTQIINKKPLTIYGKGTQTRSFCYVDDLVEGLIKAITTKGSEGEIFNLGNPEEFTILELASLLKELTNSDVPVIFQNLPENDPKQRKPVIDKAKLYLNWSPKVSLQEGMQKTILWFKKQKR